MRENSSPIGSALSRKKKQFNEIVRTEKERFSLIAPWVRDIRVSVMVFDEAEVDGECAPHWSKNGISGYDVGVICGANSTVDDMESIIRHELAHAVDFRISTHRTGMGEGEVNYLAELISGKEISYEHGNTPLTTKDKKMVEDFFRSLLDEMGVVAKTLHAYKKHRPNPSPTESVLSRRYFHATSNQAAGEAILRDGVLKPSNLEGRRGHMSPVQGRLYLSPDMETAAIYSLGGVLMGSDHERIDHNDNDRYGWVFEVSPRDFGDVQPDEDHVGEAASYAMGVCRREESIGSDVRVIVTDKYSDNPSNTDFVRNLLKDKELLIGLFHLANTLTPTQRRKINQGEYSYWASGGKRMLKNMPVYIHKKLMDVGSHLAHAGSLPIIRAWKVDKTRSVDIAKDGSNLFDVAEKVYDATEEKQHRGNPTIKLWRATEHDDAADLGTRTAWAEERKHAEAYLDNPGFGGPALWRTIVNYEYDDVLDLCAKDNDNDATKLAEVLLDDEDYASEMDRQFIHTPRDLVEHYNDRGIRYIHNWWEEDHEVFDVIASRFKWIRFYDDYPEGCVTWIWLGDDDVDAKEIKIGLDRSVTYSPSSVLSQLERTGAPPWAAQKVCGYKEWKIVDLDTDLFGFIEVMNQGKISQYGKMPLPTMPPVVAVPVEDTGEYEIIDGNHRAAVCAEREVKCPTWVPVLERA